MTSSILTFAKVGLTYPSISRKGPPQRVLDAIDFSLSGGEFIVIIGRSGSGKTSLLNLAAGFQTPTEGSILVNGVPIVGPGVERAVVFQDDALYPWLNARDNVAFPLKLRGQGASERRNRAEALLALVGLSDVADRRIWELSGGMRQRVGIARALASEPQFLLLDEPLGALDALTRTKMQGFLLDVWKRSGAGALLITHSIEEALLLATRVIVLAPHPGRVLATIDTGFAELLLAGAAPETVRATPLFENTYAQLTELINTLSEAELAA